MNKSKTIFICSECGTNYPKWVGRCTACGKWDSVIEEAVIHVKSRTRQVQPPEKLDKISEQSSIRISSEITEIDRVVGGGFVPGSVILLGGEPGIGKSTLALQIAGSISAKEKTAMIFSGEESTGQIAMRAKRLKIGGNEIQIQNESSLEAIAGVISEQKPKMVIIDSIQTVFSENVDGLPGSISQIRACASQLLSKAKESGFILILIGHITKEGAIAGPKLLEHLVDTVLYLEGDKHHLYRLLRSVKNRFGATYGVGVFEMMENGLVSVEDPSGLFLAERNEFSSGSVVVPSLDGGRVFLVEIQALTAPANYGTPQRSVTGLNRNRLNMLLAVLERRVGVHVGTKDVFVNLVGGLKIEEPAMDLGITCAIVSSLKDEPIAKEFAMIGEIGLGGEIRSVPHLDRRLTECKQMGFSKILVPKGNLKKMKSIKNLEIIGVVSLNDAMEILF
ncbi:DNA repair protein RadA [bacterium]|nr:DNA repair protein RadA [bacterium]